MKIKTFKGGFDNNFGYFIISKSRKAIAIDPILPNDMLDYIKKNDLNLIYIINTHSHFDHVSGNDFLKQNTGADILNPKDNKEIKIEELHISFIHTPGHTEESRCIMITDTEERSSSSKALFTGDTLFVGCIGKTWKEEDSKTILASIKKLMKLDDDIIIYPGHDYGSSPTSTIKKEKDTNPYLQD